MGKFTVFLLAALAVFAIGCGGSDPQVSQEEKVNQAALDWADSQGDSFADQAVDSAYHQGGGAVVRFENGEVVELKKHRDTWSVSNHGENVSYWEDTDRASQALGVCLDINSGGRDLDGATRTEMSRNLRVLTHAMEENPDSGPSWNPVRKDLHDMLPSLEKCFPTLAEEARSALDNLD